MIHVYFHPFGIAWVLGWAVAAAVIAVAAGGAAVAVATVTSLLWLSGAEESSGEFGEVAPISCLSVGGVRGVMMEWVQ